ncbi:MAG TPA: ferritin [Anaerolineaceae bacterium]|nr:ferritin [Anaerolineaceae bacterium]
MDKRVYEAMNDQINHELYSAYFYLAMSAYCESENLSGAARWLRVQAKEEQEHAMKFFEYLHDRGEKVLLKPIGQPPVEFTSLKDVFAKVYEHEQKVTALLSAIYEKALEAKDVASQVLLHWYLMEQVEEEKNASTILAMLEKAGTSVGALFQIDHELGERGAE